MSQVSYLESRRFGGEGGAGGEGWERFVAESFHGDQVWPLGDPSGFEGSLTRRWIDDLLLTETKTSPHVARFGRTPTPDYVVVWGGHPAGGERAVLVDDSEVESDGLLSVIDTGTVLMYEQYRPRHGYSLFIPKDALMGRGARIDRMRLPRNIDHSISAQLLLTMLKSLLQPRVIPAAEVIAIRAALLGLFQGLKPEEVAETSPAVNDAMRTRVESWVARELLEGEITPDAAARAQGISVRSLHRLFSRSGQTFTGFVRAVRLESARNELATTSITVQGIASRWGYSDVSHLCREFKKAYSMTTTDFRASLAEARVLEQATRSDG